MRARHVGVDLVHWVVRVAPPRIVWTAAVPLWLSVHAAMHVHAVGGNRLHVLLVEREALVVRRVLVVACELQDFKVGLFPTGQNSVMKLACFPC